MHTAAKSVHAEPVAGMLAGQVAQAHCCEPKHLQSRGPYVQESPHMNAMHMVPSVGCVTGHSSQSHW